MLYDAREGDAIVGGTPMHYAVFGRGPKTLVIIPGLSDGLKTVHGMAAGLALTYHRFAKHFRVYVFSRKDELAEGATTRDMAADLRSALGQLGIESCCVLGVSQGGMIALHLAIGWPKLVEKLVLAVSAAQASKELQTSIHRWMAMAEAGDYRALMADTCEQVYSPKRLRLYRPLYPLMGRIGKPEDFSRFLIQANACLEHNACDDLPQIQCPTLIVGGAEDKVVGGGAARELAGGISKSRLVIYEGLGHGTHEEARGFNRHVLNFLLA